MKICICAFWLCHLLLALPLAAAAVAAPPLVLDDGARLSWKWQFLNGGEFPGAQGSLQAAPAGFLLAYDFTKGGKYVAAARNLALSGRVTAFSLKVEPAQDCLVFFRLTDANSRTFEAAGPPLKGKVATTLTLLPLDAPWRAGWGGKAGCTVLTPPVKTIQLCIANDQGLPNRGTLAIRELAATGEQLAVAGAQGEAFTLAVQGWRLAGAWQGPADAPALVITATPPPGAAGADLTVSVPTSGRDFVKRFRLKDNAPSAIVFEPPLPNGVNPRNRYPVTVSLNSGTCEGRIVTSLNGALSAGLNFGAPKSSRQIRSLPFGTCTHLSYGYGSQGPFAGWGDYRRLIDAMADCGYKWIRDGVGSETGADGAPRVRPYDLEWIRYAKDQGIRTIVVIDFDAAEPTDKLVARALAIARDTRGLVDVFELSNEPHNFGGWMTKYGGTWNGKEPDNATSRWVKEFVKATNTVADALRKARPEAKIIGLGACPPTNFRMLDLGITPSMDGVVDHPYTYSMPPEKIPYGTDLTERDGVRVGDAEGTFAGLVDSYVTQFRKTGRPRTLWMTEFGFTTYRFNGANETGMYGGYSEAAQAVYLVRRFIQSLAMPVIAVSCQYDFIDDYGSDPGNAEANFGILRADFSPKPAYLAIQRLNSLVDACQSDAAASVEILDGPLHRAMIRGELIKDWDKVTMKASNAVMALALVNPAVPAERLLAVWSTQPYSGEFNCRAATVGITGWEPFGTVTAVGINLITGDTFDVPVKNLAGRLVLEKLSVGPHPLLIKFFRP